MSEKDYNPPMHTVEHLLNGFVSKQLGSPRAFSTHIEKKKSKIDISSSRGLTAEESIDIENRVNEVLSRGVDITTEMLPIDEARIKYDLSRLPMEVRDDVRIVHIGEYDSCPCIGSHVENTSEIEGKLKIISSDYDPERGVLRIRFKIVK